MKAGQLPVISAFQLWNQAELGPSLTLNDKPTSLEGGRVLNTSIDVLFRSRIGPIRLVVVLSVTQLTAMT